MLSHAWTLMHDVHNSSKKTQVKYHLILLWQSKDIIISSKKIQNGGKNQWL